MTYFLHFFLTIPGILVNRLLHILEQDPLNFLFLFDPYGPYLIEFLIKKNRSFLLIPALGRFLPFPALVREGVEPKIIIF